MTGAPPPTITAVPALPEGWHVVRYELLDRGRLAIIGADVDLLGAWRTDVEQKTVGEMKRLVAVGSLKLWIIDDGQLLEQISVRLNSPFPSVQQFRDGRWLVIEGRSDHNGNARVLNADGSEIRRIELGDGINQVQIDGHDRIWVGWFDEGVFGNSRWLHPGHKWPVSAHGIAAFDEHGALLHHATLESIADCYALNAFDNEAWSCTYTAFPIWRMVDGAERTWKTNLNGASAIAIRFPYVLVAGAYEPNSDLVTLLKLHERAAETLGEWRVPAPQRGDLGLVAAHGDELHIVADGQWMRWRVADFVKLNG